MLPTKLPLPKPVRLPAELPPFVVQHMLLPSGRSHLSLAIRNDVKLAQLDTVVDAFGEHAEMLDEIVIARVLNDAAGTKVGAWSPLGRCSRLDLGGLETLSKGFLENLFSGPKAAGLRHVRRTSMTAASLTPLLKLRSVRGFDLSPKGKVLASSWVSKLEKSKAIAQVAALHTYGMLPDWDKALSGPLGAGLKEFGIGGAAALTGAAEALRRAEALEVLSIRDPRAPVRFADWPAAKALRALVMDQATLDAQAFDELDSWGVLPQLRFLCIGDAGGLAVERLVARDDLALEGLVLAGKGMSPDSLATLAEWPGFTRLRTLVIRTNDEKLLPRFAEVADLSNLRWLAIGNRDHGDEPFAAIDAMVRANPSAEALAHGI